MSRILHLTLKKKWFDMIASGEKTEEYRQIKPFWLKRLFLNENPEQPFRFDIVRFRNGYGRNSPVMDVEWKNCWVGEGKEEWGGVYNEIYYVIWLGEILSIKNYKQ